MNKVKNSKTGKAIDIDNVALAIWRYWVGEKPGGTCDFGDTDFLTPEEMVLLLEHKFTYNQYAEWREENLRHTEQGFINLRSWIMSIRHEMYNNHSDHYVK